MSSTSAQSEFAKRQLERMGWKEGNGLGKDRQGRSAPIIVQKRSDVTGGLGIEKEKVRQVQQTIQDEWWKDALGDTLSKLSNKKDKKKKRKRENDKNDCNETTMKKIYTDEELFIATGGARFGMRAGKTRNQAKWRRTEAQESKVIATQHDHDGSHEEIETDRTTIASNGIEQAHTIVKAGTKLACNDSTNKKEKTKKIRSVVEKQSGENVSEPVLKKKKDQDKVIEIVEKTHETVSSDNIVSVNPSNERKRKKKKNKK